jgi:hypothetical protein
MAAKGLGTGDWGLARLGTPRNQAEPRTQRQRSKRSLEKWDACRPAGRDSTAWWGVPFPELACGYALGYSIPPSGLGEIRDSRPS